MSEQLILYRGDGEKIRDFKFNKTSKYSLFGQGVYLTDSVKIANSYRTKGNHNELGRFTAFFENEAKDRIDAYQKAFTYFAKNIYFREYVSPSEVLNYREEDQYIKKNHDKIYKLYRDLIDNKRITSEYYNGHREIRDKSKISGYRIQSFRGIRVIYESEKVAGYLTEFAFDKKTFMDAMIYVDDSKHIQDEQIFEIAIAHEMLDVFRPRYRALADEVKITDPQVFVKEGFCFRHVREASFYDRIRKVYQRYGYRGFIYDGGMRLGGKIHHNAFVVWDENFVNDHKVRRTRTYN